MTQEELYAKYPERFKDVYCGFSIGYGWISLVDEACSKLELECQRTGASYFVVQVKEKFGGLRLYIDIEGPENGLFRIASEYESKSYGICEDCGSPGALTKGGWARTVCSVCRTK